MSDLVQVNELEQREIEKQARLAIEVLAPTIDPEGKGVDLRAKTRVVYHHPSRSQIIEKGEVVHAFRKAYFNQPFRLSDTFWIYRNNDYIALHQNIIAESFEIVS